MHVLVQIPGGWGGDDGEAGGLGGLSQGAVSEPPTYRRALTVLEGSPERAPMVARQVILSVRLPGERLGVAARKSAAAPATCGQAIEVPDMVVVAVSDV